MTFPMDQEDLVQAMKEAWDIREAVQVQEVLECMSITSLHLASLTVDDDSARGSCIPMPLLLYVHNITPQDI